ncbi:MAG: hypothetical protein AB8H79_23120 [Myxococcota bacterium]
MRKYALAVMVGLLVACGDDPENSTDPTDDSDTDDSGVVESFIEGRDCPPDSPLTYDNFGESLMLSRCAGCHGDAVEEGERLGAPLDVNLTTQAQVQDWLERVYARSADDNVSMPIVDNIDPIDRVRLGDWLACGAP